jgi:site-specific DNA-methyltransferase (adenine-specific)
MIVITVARKPIERTVAANALKWGTGGINIDDSRISHTEDFSDIKSRSAMKLNSSGKTHDPECDSVREVQAKLQNLGRWPANLIMCHDSAVALDDQSGIQSEVKKVRRNCEVNRTAISTTAFDPKAPNLTDSVLDYGDSGGASRFFKVVKP